MEEIWKDIKEYEGLYQVSNLGNIKSLRRNKLIKYSKDNKGYLRTSLAKNGINRTVKVHRIVAQAFINNDENKPQVNHKNGNKTDNNVENLEWVSNQENQNHSWNTGLRKKGKEHWSYGKIPPQLAKVIGCGKNNPNYNNRGVKNPLSKKVQQLDKENKIIKLWYGIAEASRELKICSNTISLCCKGKRKTAGGYKWQYA